MSIKKARGHSRQYAEKKATQKRTVVILTAVGGILILIALLWAGLRPVADTNDTASASVASNASETGADLVVGAQRGMAAPDFQLTTLDGNAVALSDYAGKVAVVNLWATWCPPCRAEMPGMNLVYETYKADGLVVLAVNGREDRPTVNSFIQSQEFNFPVLLDPDGQVMQKYSVNSFPTTFIIDRDGIVRHVQNGAITAQELEKIVTSLLG